MCENDRCNRLPKTDCKTDWEQKGHYCLAVKTNQAILYEEIKDYFSYTEKEEPERLSTYQTIEKNHGRIKKRKYQISPEIEYLTGKENWKGLKAIGKVESIREVNGEKSLETRYYILDQEMTSEEMSHIVRGHWEMENNLHWVLDVHFREDACKTKEEKAMQNLSLIRKICYNLMKLDKRFDKKKKMTYKKMSMLYTCHLEYVQELIFQKIAENI
ncbi:ISAs1 family transposase [Faecalicatena contorta]|nr:ISAs1 family transposase [Faecalicatena contorta]